jgi:phospholipid transport system substrate-binding protein
MKLIAKYCLAAFLAWGMSIAYAADPALDMLKQVTNEMTSTLKARNADIKKDPNVIVDIVESIAIPHIAVPQMSQAVLGVYWRTATPEQRVAFQEAFERWAILSYSAAFLNYTDQEIVFGKVQPIGSKGDREQINTAIKQSDGTNIVVNYRVVNMNGKWMVYDINVENVSLVTSFRSQVAGPIKQKGLDAVIADLNARNAKGLSK